MLTIVKPVYYCEHCKRHRMTAASIERHEPRCIYNPNRSVCGWHDDKVALGDPLELAKAFKQELDADWLRPWVGGCPACMLAVVVQAQLTVEERDDCGFSYAGEVERFRASEEHDYGY
jgi:hypothetical protein